MDAGRFTIPTRIFLTSEQRRKLDALVRERDIDLSDLVTELVESYLDHMPEPELALEAPMERVENQLQRHKSDLARLRARMVAAGNSAPPWLAQFVADLEAEVARLEGRR